MAPARPRSTSSSSRGAQTQQRRPQSSNGTISPPRRQGVRRRGEDEDDGGREHEDQNDRGGTEGGGGICMSSPQVAHGVIVQTLLAHGGAMRQHELETLFIELQSSLGLSGDFSDLIEQFNNATKHFGISLETVQADVGPPFVALQFAPEESPIKVWELEMQELREERHVQLLIAIIAKIVESGRELLMSEVEDVFRTQLTPFGEEAGSNLLKYFVRHHWLELCDAEHKALDSQTVDCGGDQDPLLGIPFEHNSNAISDNNDNEDDTSNHRATQISGRAKKSTRTSEQPIQHYDSQRPQNSKNAHITEIDDCSNFLTTLGKGLTLGARTYLEILPHMPGVECCDLCQSEVVIRPSRCPTPNCGVRFHSRCIDLALATRRQQDPSGSGRNPTCPFCQNQWTGIKVPPTPLEASSPSRTSPGQRSGATDLPRTTSASPTTRAMTRRGVRAGRTRR